MKMMPKLRPNRWDFFTAFLVAALALLSAWKIWEGNSGETLSAVVSVDGKQTEMISLTDLQEPEELTLTANGFTLHLVLDQTGVRMASSNCPTQDCVHTGTINHAGQSIVCLPARVSVQLVGGEENHDAVDIVIG